MRACCDRMHGACCALRACADRQRPWFTAFASSQLRPVYNDGQELRNITNLPLLGVVSIILTDAERKSERNSRLRFFFGSGGLVAMFVVIMVTMSILAARQVG